MKTGKERKNSENKESPLKVKYCQKYPVDKL